MPGCLYRLTSPSGKSYIGVTNNSLGWRWGRHVGHAMRGKKYLISQAIRKYGAENFKIEVLVYAEGDEYLKDLEVKAIAAFRTMTPSGYNMTAGGNGVSGGCTEAGQRRIEAFRKTAATEESKRKRSLIHRESWNDEEKVRLRSRSVADLWKDPAYREKMSAYHARRSAGKAPKPPLLSKSERSARLSAAWTDERKAAQSARTKASLSTPESRERLSRQQAMVIADPAVRRKIGNTLSEFGDCLLSKGVMENPFRSDAVLYPYWDALPETFGYWHLRDLGASPKAVARAIRRGQFIVVGRI